MQGRNQRRHFTGAFSSVGSDHLARTRSEASDLIWQANGIRDFGSE